MKLTLSLLIPLILSALLPSCISYQKYEDVLAQRDQLQADYNQASDQLSDVNQRNDSLKARLQSVEEQLEEARANLQESRQRFEQLNQANQDLLERYSRMLEQNQKLLEATSEEKQELTTQLSSKQLELDQRERELREMAARLEKKEADLEALRQDLQEREARVQELEAAIAEKDAKLSALQEKISQALLGFSDTDLSVREENGKVYVSMSQNLLFPSGSKTINRAGKEAIDKLAEVLKANPDIAITVEGHTDSEGDAAYNWDLSVARATSVVKELTTDGVDPKRITASGRGEFYPVASNETAAGRAQNRRTEIILSPRLDALYNIINNEAK